VRLRTLLAAAGLDAVGASVRLGHPGGTPRGVTGEPATDPEVTGIVLASGQVNPGALFACVPGNRADGHDYAGEAVEKGAVAVLCERSLDLPVPQVLVPSVRQILGNVSAAFWAYPARAMKVIGVTGTNGKTTTCAVLASIFEANGWPAGVIGTLTGERTTPEAPVLQRELARLRNEGTQAVAMEVSSHALAQYRTDGTDFAAGVFTNLSQDHLDYHHTMEAYFASKAQLFTRGQVGVAVVNREGPWGARLAELLSGPSGGGAPLVTFGPSDASEVTVGERFTAFLWRGRRFELNLRGRFNVTNAVAAATTASELGVGWDAISAGLAAVPLVRGRFEPVDQGQPFSVLVDFAHTPGALAEALRGARELAGEGLRTAPGEAGHFPGSGPGRVIVVFGAGGDRDRAKRPMMGQVASELADVVVITSDNPRSERPLAIIEEVASGANGRVTPLVDVDRARAIAGALGMANAGDVVLVAGKGHETGQDFGSHVEPFDDAEVVGAVLKELGYDRAADGDNPRRVGAK
jgi:UDP-N-acetylmuramoyl-L-alanyl-D-glutamate--2,6-diaminopimelate ligase